MVRPTVQVADSPPPAPRRRVVADLHIRVGDDRGTTLAHLGNEADGLVLSVDEPAMLLRALPGRRLARDVPIRIPRELMDGVSVRLRSRGRDLGWMQMRAGGRVHVRPTPNGALLAARTVASSRTSRRALEWTAAAVVALVLAARLGSRRH